MSGWYLLACIIGGAVVTSIAWFAWLLWHERELFKRKDWEP